MAIGRFLSYLTLSWRKHVLRNTEISEFPSLGFKTDPSNFECLPLRRVMSCLRPRTSETARRFGGKPRLFIRITSEFRNEHKEKASSENSAIESWRWRRRLLCFWTLSIDLFSSKTHDVSETGFCLRLQVWPTQLGPSIVLIFISQHQHQHNIGYM
jgi:hypothetical protein